MCNKSVRYSFPKQNKQFLKNNKKAQNNFIFDLMTLSPQTLQITKIPDRNYQCTKKMLLIRNSIQQRVRKEKENLADLYTSKLIAEKPRPKIELKQYNS